MPMATTQSSRSRHPRTRARTRILFEAWAGAAIFVALFALAGTVSPEQPGHYPTCPFRALTGFACPGCGSLRALHDLAHGHFIIALMHNAMLVTALPFAVVTWLRIVTGRAAPAASPHWSGWAAIAVLVAWTVVRNLPGVRGVLAAA